MDHLYVVSLPKDETTLRNKAKDCVTLGTLQVGDEVIVCEKCRLTGIYRKKDWTGHCQFCGGSETLRFPNGMDAVFFPAKVLGGAKQNHAQKQTPPPQRKSESKPRSSAEQQSPLKWR